MNEFGSEHLLLEYPGRWNAMQEKRDQIIDAYGCGEAYHEAATGSGYGDKTFKKAVRLVALDEEETCLKVVREWLAVGLDPKDRVFLICLWRGRTLAEMDRDAGRIGSARQRLQDMVRGLNRFAGLACVEHGPACAASRKKSRPDS